MKKIELTVIIATHNEEANIGKCLESVKDIVDEILIADGESTDKTVEIAKSYGSLILPMSNKRMFHFNKEEAKKHAKGEWILFLDADEIIPKKLAAEIRQVVEGKHRQIVLNKQFAKHTQFLEQRDHVRYTDTPPINGYFIARKNYFLGHYLMHSGVYPDGVIRLVRNGTAYWPCKDVHETMVVEGGVSWLSEAMIHMADPTFSRYLWRANRYTSLTADNLQQMKISKNAFSFIQYILLKPITTFFLLFFRHKGFMDGFSGFVWALMSGLHFPIAYMKYVQRDTRK
ncbi:MAG: glycosyltransferase family 2 protein [Candidatus Woesebacteria bacterium]